MINRILIRMKVVQLLYSYMLTRSDFKIISEPERLTRDTRYGYGLYQSLLLLLLEITGFNTDPSRRKSLLDNVKYNTLPLKLTKSLSSDSRIRDLMGQRLSLTNYADAAKEIYEQITASTVYKDFSRLQVKDLADEVNMWVVILDTIIAKNKLFIQAARADENFTQAGYDLGIKMLRETLVSYGENRTAFLKAKNALDESLEKSYELYHLLLLLPVEITQLQKQRIISAKEKYIPTSSDLNPNTRFIDNEFVKLVSESDEMADYLKVRPIDLEVHFPQIKQLLDNILTSRIYAEYMEMESTDRAQDCEFWRKVMKSIILPSDSLIEILENGSIYWNDDLEIMGTFALKTIKQTASSEGQLKLLPKFKDTEDANFGAKLFLDTIHNRESYRGYIDKFIDPKQWDSDRLAYMDIIIMMVAIAEIINFPAIPIPVTMNEYIEIANSYSTNRSGQFINGMLFSIVKYLRAEGIIIKE